jgi:excisionase family DNA binding protein
MELANYFFTASQAALELSVTRITIWRWTKEGKFNVQRIGRESLIPKWEVELIKRTGQPKR